MPHASERSRAAGEHGAEAAIRIARAASMPLQIAAKVSRSDTRYFKERIEPLVDGKLIRLIGEVNDFAKQTFLAGASALLFPIDWPEPFGLVMIEAMACGTPVIAFRSGSVPELIDHGVTGFILDTEAEAADAIGHLSKIDRRRVRAIFEQRFTSKRMAEEYLRYYEMLIGGMQLPIKTTVSRPIEPQPDSVPRPESPPGRQLRTAEEIPPRITWRSTS